MIKDKYLERLIFNYTPMCDLRKVYDLFAAKALYPFIEFILAWHSSIDI